MFGLPYDAVLPVLREDVGLVLAVCLVLLVLGLVAWVGEALALKFLSGTHDGGR